MVCTWKLNCLVFSIFLTLTKARDTVATDSQRSLNTFYFAALLLVFLRDAHKFPIWILSLILPPMHTFKRRSAAAGGLKNVWRQHLCWLLLAMLVGRNDMSVCWVIGLCTTLVQTAVSKQIFQCV